MIIGGKRPPHGLWASGGGGRLSSANRKAKFNKEFIFVVFSVGNRERSDWTTINGQSAQNSLATDRGSRLLAEKCSNLDPNQPGQATLRMTKPLL